MAVCPLPRGRVVAQAEHSDGGGDYEDEGNDVGYSPRHVGSEVMGVDERVKDGGHNEATPVSPTLYSVASMCELGGVLSYPGAGVPPATSKRIGRPHDIFVKESCAPHLARYETAAENTHEEAYGDEAARFRREAGHGGGDGAG